MFQQLIPELVVGVLTTLVRVKQHIFGATPQLNRHAQGFTGQRGIGDHRKRPAHYPTRVQIQDCRDVRGPRKNGTLKVINYATHA
jgi:hypothetical protein